MTVHKLIKSHEFSAIPLSLSSSARERAFLELENSKIQQNVTKLIFMFLLKTATDVAQ